MSITLMRRLLGLLVCLSLANPVLAQFRNEAKTVEAINHDYPELIRSGHPCGAFVDQVAHRLNRHDQEVRWGRKARQADGGNPNCDTLAYLSVPEDRSRKVLVDIIINGPDPGRDDPTAAPSWQESPGDNLGNGFWVEPQTADRDATPVPIPAPQPIQLDRIERAVYETHLAVIRVETSLEEHRRISRDWVDRTLAFLKSPKTIAAVFGILAGKFLVPGGK